MELYYTKLLKDIKSSILKRKIKKDDDSIDIKLKEIQVNLLLLNRLVKSKARLRKRYDRYAEKKIQKKLIQESQELLNLIIPDKKNNYVSQDTLDSRAWKQAYRDDS